MGTTSDKLTYLSGTKDKLKTAINYTGANITNDTFRSYPEKLYNEYIDIINNGTGTLYSNMPKVNGQGDSLTLNNTESAPMTLALKGNTSQASDPTPDSPVDVNVVSGDNTIEICGKNLFDKDNKVVVEKKILNDSGVEVSDNSGGYTKMYIPVQSNTTYTISGVSSTGTKRIYFFDNTKTFISRTSQETSGQSSFSFTTPNNCKYIDIQFYYYSGYNLNTIQIEKGSTASTYEPYTGNSQLISLGVENLVNNTLSSGTYNGITYVVNEDKSVTLSGTATATTWLILNSSITLQAGTYTMSSGNTSNTIRMYCGALGGYTSDGIRTKTLTSSQTSDISINIPNGTVIDTPITIYPMVEKGSKANSYSPYGTTPIELNKISTYQDYIYKSNNIWYLHKEIGKVVLDGSENNWSSLNASARAFKLSNFDNGNGTDTQTNYSILSSHFLSNTQGMIYSGTIGIQALGGTVKALYISFGSSSSISTVAELETWLSTHNTDVYYVLDTPTDTEITDTTLLEQLNNLEQIKSKKHQTNINQENNDLPFIITASALKEYE